MHMPQQWGEACMKLRNGKTHHFFNTGESVENDCTVTTLHVEQAVGSSVDCRTTQQQRPAKASHSVAARHLHISHVLHVCH